MSEPNSEIAVFRATIPPYKSAIQAHGDGTGGSIRLEIPQTERETLKLLMDMTQVELIVTIARAAPREHAAEPEPVTVRRWREPKLKN